MEIDCGLCTLRPWRDGDQDSVVRHGNSRNIWLNLRDRFPHPYTREAADSFIRMASQDSASRFAIDIDGEAVGSIGLEQKHDVERVSAEIGYWLGEALSGRGIMTAAVRSLALYGLRDLRLTRVFALPFARNAASIRVLEKAGFQREGLLRRAAIKDGIVLDQLLYSLTDLDLTDGAER